MSHPLSLSDQSLAQIDGGNIAISSPDAIDETCFSIPAVRAVHNAYPNGTIVVFAPEDVAPLWRKVEEVDEVIAYDAHASARNVGQIIKDLKIKFTKSIAWENNPATGGFAQAVIPIRMGTPERELLPHLTHPVEVARPIGPIEHRVRHYLFFMQKLGAMPFDKSNFLHPERPLGGEKFRVAIVPGSDFGDSTEWPLANYVTLTRTLMNYADVTIIPSQDRLGPAIALGKEVGRPEFVFQGDNGEILDHLATCHGLVGNDGSIPHLAAFMGTKSLVLFGPNEPLWKRPLGKQHQFIRHHVPCSGCLLAKCPLDHRCMMEITVEEVLGEMRTLFSP